MIKTSFVFPTIRTGFPAFFLSLGLAMTSLPAQAAAPVGAEERFACSAPEEAEMGEPVICRTQLSAKGKPLVVRLYWDILADTDEWHVFRIETARSETGKAMATLELDSRAPLSMRANGFEFGDFNFDGYQDFRLIEFLPAGPNVAYYNALYDPRKGRHVTADALNMVSAPSFDAAEKLVISAWRGNAVTHGTDSFAWDDGELLLRKRTVSVFDDAGKCMTTAYEPKGRVTAEALLTGADSDALLSEVYEAPCSN